MNNELTIIFRVTCDCNINCEYCYAKGQRKLFGSLKATREIIDHTAKLVADFTDEAQWIWHGGEPTLMGKQFYRDIQDVFYNHYQCEFRQGMQSNGVLASLDYDWVDTLNSLGIDLGLSFDGYTQYIRMGDNFTQEELIDRYFNLMSYIQKTNKNKQSSGAITVVHAKNIDRLIDMYELYKVRLPDSVPAFNFVFNAVGNHTHGLGISREDYVTHFSAYCEHLWLDASSNSIMERTVNQFIIMLFSAEKHSLCTYIDCRGGWLGIQPDGGIIYCDRELADKYTVGNIMDYNSIEDIYNSKGFKTMFADIGIRLSYCTKCPYFEFCGGNCNSNHGTYNDGLMDKVSLNVCLPFQLNFISTLRVVEKIKLDTPINRHIHDMLLRAPSLLPCEISYFLKRNSELITLLIFT